MHQLGVQIEVLNPPQKRKKKVGVKKTVIYRYFDMGIFKGTNAHIGINPYMDIHAYIDIYAYIGKMPIGINDMPIQ